MKNLFRILLICLLIGPFLGTYAWMHFEKAQIRKQVKKKMIEGIDKEELVLLTFSYEDAEKLLKWKHSKEFEYNGQMYDVVELKKDKNQISYWCWHDHKETKLNKELRRLVAIAFGDNPENKERQKQLSDFFKSLYHNNSSVIQFNSEIYIPIASVYTCFYYSHTETPPVPPPWIC